MEVELTGEVLARGVLATLCYALLGAALLALGLAVLDRLTPGSLLGLVYNDRCANAAVTACAQVAALTTIVTVAVLASDGGLFGGLLVVAVFGLLGVLLQAIGFKVVDVLTPGRLGAILTDPEPHPAVWLTATLMVALGVILAVALS